LIEPSEHEPAATGRVLRRKRLGGMLNFYHRAAAGVLDPRMAHYAIA